MWNNSPVQVTVPERGEVPGPDMTEDEGEPQLDDPAVTLKCLKLLVCILQV